MRQSRLFFVLRRDYLVAFAVILNEVKYLKQLILSHQSIEILHSFSSFRMTMYFFSNCPGDEKVTMRLGTYSRNPHVPAILIHPRIS